MSDRIKKIKVKKADGSMTDYIPIGADAENIDFENGYSLDEIIGDINPDEDGTIEDQLFEVKTGRRYYYYKNNTEVLPKYGSYYVNGLTGDDNNPGTSDKPFKTLTPIFRKIDAGDTEIRFGLAAGQSYD